MSSNSVHLSNNQETEDKAMDNNGQGERYIHKVSVPPKQNLFKEFTMTLRETFFADDPLRPFKDQSKSRKVVLGVQAIFPIFEWSRNYSFKKFKGDIIAGLTIASLCIPQVGILVWLFYSCH